MKKIFHFLFSRVFITAVLIIVQIVIIAATVLKFASYQVWTDTVLKLLSLLMVLFLLRSDENSPYKLIWILVMTLVPVLGGLLYVFAGNRRPARKMRKLLENSIGGTAAFTEQDIDVTGKMPPRIRQTSEYISSYGGFPVYDNTSADYFRCGEDFYGALIDELGKAEKFIFLEYFIIAEGKAWDKIIRILTEKAAQGVDVRIIYDDIGSIAEIPRSLHKNIPDGIKTAAFNPFVPFFSVVMNHRDHRKIAVIDGKTAFTGGINLADEYMNIKTVFGYWKDTAVMIKGSAVFSFTVMFAQMWNAFSEDKINIGKCRCECDIPEESAEKIFVQPFSDSPLDNEQVSESVYLDLISQAERYVYIFTPYLMIDDQMKAALCLAAKRGTDVRIVTPGIPDKKAVFRITRSYYQALISAGVRIYEYTPGFIHAKSIICDGRTAVVGSINMDFRSLYLHFECGVMIASLGECAALTKLYEDCVSVFGQSREIMPDESRHFSRLIGDAVLRALSPLV